MSIISDAHIKFNKYMFNKTVKNITSTPPVQVDSNSKLVVLSMLQHSDVNMYLLAIKSFCSYLSPLKVVIVADPTLTETDKSVLRDHIEDVQFYDANQITNSNCPSGGTWERLLTISELVDTNYVIQLDADTITVGNPDEVINCIQKNTGFLIGTEDNQAFTTLDQASKFAHTLIQNGATHVQVQAESLLSKSGLESSKRYVRGSSGFAGFPVGSFDREQLEIFSKTYQESLGELWKSWGTEQFTSNYIVANMMDSIVLPHPKYCAPHRRTSNTVFMHFIGYVRYVNNAYKNYATQIIKGL